MRYSRILLASIALMGAVPAVDAFATRPSLVFRSATGEILQQSQGGEPSHPASLKTLMTAYIVFGKLNTGELALSKDIDVAQEPISHPPSRVDLDPGAKITVDLAIQAMR